MGNKWEEMYKRKLTTAEEAVKNIKDGDKVFSGGASTTPDKLINALLDRVEELRGVVIGGLIVLGIDRILKKELMPHIEYDNYYSTVLDREALHQGICFHTPFHFSELPKLTCELAGYRKQFVQVCPMDKNGYMNCSVSGNGLGAMDWHDEIYVEVNEYLPRVHGLNSYHVTQVTHIVENHRPIIELPPEPPSEKDRAIAEHIVKHVEDGSTIQLGIGALPNAVGECLMERKHLGCHTEMMSDAYMKLFEAEVLDNSKKTFHPFQMNGFFAIGSKQFYDWLDDNPMIYFSPISYNNDPYNVAKNDKMISINSCLEIDITGQCCSESFGPYQFTATGGQVDFTRGAWMSRGGKAFIATHSTAKDYQTGETVSKIVPQLRPGAVVTLTRTDIMYVATEYGVVNLKGKSLRERARALISIAHPDFRGELRKYAREVKYFILPEHDVFD